MITIDRLKEVLSYDEDSGNFFWKKRLSQRSSVGKLAGCKNKKRLEIRIDGQLYLAHKLAWFMKTGNWPYHEIDHKDLNGLNNSFKNLRYANHSLNGANIRAHKDNALGVKGVTYEKSRKKYVAQLSCGGKKVLYKRFDAMDDAKQAYDLAASQYFGEYARYA